MTQELRALLDDFEQALASMTSFETVRSIFRPGATESAIAAAEERLGHELTTEARTYWSWHDGTTALRRAGDVPFTLRLTALDLAVDESLRRRAEIGSLVDATFADADVDWDKAVVWGDQGGGGSWWLTDTGEHSRVVSLSEELEQGPSASSLADVFREQLRSYTDGLWSQKDGRWVTPFERLTPTQRAFGLLVAP